MASPIIQQSNNSEEARPEIQSTHPETERHDADHPRLANEPSLESELQTEISTITTVLQALTTANTSGRLEEFHLFPKLPFELRSDIWRQSVATIEPRSVGLLPNVAGNTIPPILHACQEIRAEALKKYHRCVVSAF